MQAGGGSCPVPIIGGLIVTLGLFGFFDRPPPRNPHGCRQPRPLAGNPCFYLKRRHGRGKGLLVMPSGFAGLRDFAGETHCLVLQLLFEGCEPLQRAQIHRLAT
jgi:hypothetical protein